MRTAIWLSYDLGVNGDYESLYSWLDNHGAKECGSSVAFLKSYRYEGDLKDCLKKELGSAVSLDNRSRIYIVYRNGEKISGHYLIGRRKGAPWEGFGDRDEVEEDVSESSEVR